MNAILLNTAESAEVLRVAAITLHRWRNTGKGPPYIEMGRKVYYRRTDLDCWIEEQQRRPQAAADTAPTSKSWTVLTGEQQAERDRKILELHRQGLKNPEIGRRVGLTEGSIRRALKRVGGSQT